MLEMAQQGSQALPVAIAENGISQIGPGFVHPFQAIHMGMTAPAKAPKLGKHIPDPMAAFATGLQLPKGRSKGCRISPLLGLMKTPEPITGTLVASLCPSQDHGRVPP